MRQEKEQRCANQDDAPERRETIAFPSRYDC